MAIALAVKEWMRGYVGFGEADPRRGARLGFEQELHFEHQIAIRIPDIERFVEEKCAEIEGYVECDALGGRCELGRGSFRILVEAPARHLFYRAPFVDRDGKPFTMLGHKTLCDDTEPELWPNTTPLEVRIFEGHDVDGPLRLAPEPDAPAAWARPPIAAGLLRIEFFDGARRALSFEAPRTSKAEAAAAVEKFCALYGARFWELYKKPRWRAARATAWTSTEAFAATEKLAPVKWLLAGDLLRKAARIASATLGNEMDLRDWMPHDRPIDLQHGWPPHLCNRKHADASAPDVGVPPEELWFDYISDTGDHPEVMQVLATLMSKDLARSELALGAGIEPLERDLEVGPFVFFGGDTAYHIADEITLRLRVVEPFKRSMGITGEIGQKIEVPCERHLFGIPGNHDYYDHLVGFNRMFRRPYQQREGLLQIPGYALRQEASYVKILLPGGWQLWGMDLASGLDYRQWRYFGEVPDKLILCVATPPVTFGEVRVSPDPLDTEHQAYRRLFQLADQRELDLSPAAVARSLEPGQCRLHIAGDEHHYARYDSVRRGGDGGAQAPSSAVTIVSGGGGAFLHPTETCLGDLDRAAVYPSVEESSRLSSKLVDPRITASAGLVWAVGAALAVLLYWTCPESWVAAKPAWFWLGAVAASGGSLYGAYKLDGRIALARKRVTKELRRKAGAPPDAPPGAQVARTSRWDRWLVHKRVRPTVWVLALALALSAPFFAKLIEARLLGAGLDPLSRESVFLVTTAVMGLAMVRLATSRGWSWIGGLLHAVVQLGMPLGLLLQGTWIGYAIVAALAAVFVACAGRLYRAQHERGLRGERRGFAWLLALVWALQGPLATVALWAIPHLGLAEPLLPRAWWMTGIAALVGAAVATIQFGWYVLVAAAFGAHNNEVGAALRTCKYKQWIRFHVTPDEVTGYVIGVDDPLAPGARPKLVDVFRVGPKGAGPA